MWGGWSSVGRMSGMFRGVVMRGCRYFGDVVKVSRGWPYVGLDICGERVGRY